MSGIKIGSQDVKGIYLGDTQIMGSGVTNDISVKKEDTIIVIINNSGHNKTIELSGFNNDGYEEVQETIVIPSGGCLLRTYLTGNYDNYLYITEVSTMYIWEREYNSENDTAIVNIATEKSFSPTDSLAYIGYPYYNTMRIYYITA